MIQKQRKKLLITVPKRTKSVPLKHLANTQKKEITPQNGGMTIVQQMNHWIGLELRDANLIGNAKALGYANSSIDKTNNLLGTAMGRMIVRHQRGQLTLETLMDGYNGIKRLDRKWRLIIIRISYLRKKVSESENKGEN